MAEDPYSGEPRMTEENAEKFAALWGPDFKTMEFKGFPIGSSPDGSALGFFFTKENGEPYQVSLPVEWVDVFAHMLKSAAYTAYDRMVAESKESRN